MAVTGRQTRKLYLASYMAMVVSARDRSRASKAVVACARLACSPVSSCWVTWFQVFHTGAELQNLPATVWSGVRVVLVSRPRLFTSLSAVVYAALVTAGGCWGRTSWARCSTKGVTEPQVVNIGAGNFGGVGR